MPAFNMVFLSVQEFGLDCMHFNPNVYHDLLRCGDGSAEGLITAFFDVVAARAPLTIHTPCSSSLCSAECWKVFMKAFLWLRCESKHESNKTASH